MPGQRSDPFLSFRFVVEFEGITAAGFTEVSGLHAESETHDYREGGENGFVHRLAGPARYPNNLVLKRGLADQSALWDWFQAVLSGLIVRKNGTVHLLNDQREPVVSWNFRAAYPVKWTGPELRSDGNSVAAETMEFAHRGIFTI